MDAFAIEEVPGLVVPLLSDIIKFGNTPIILLWKRRSIHFFSTDYLNVDLLEP